jgi:hypothetical protein
MTKAGAPIVSPVPRVGARPLVFLPAAIARFLNLVVLVGGLGVLRGLAGLGLVGLRTQVAPVQDAASHVGLLVGKRGTGTAGDGPRTGLPGRVQLRACEDQESTCSARLMTADPMRG